MHHGPIAVRISVAIVTLQRHLLIVAQRPRRRGLRCLVGAALRTKPQTQTQCNKSLDRPLMDTEPGRRTAILGHQIAGRQLGRSTIGDRAELTPAADQAEVNLPELPGRGMGDQVEEHPFLEGSEMVRGLEPFVGEPEGGDVMGDIGFSTGSAQYNLQFCSILASSRPIFKGIFF